MSNPVLRTSAEVRSVLTNRSWERRLLPRREGPQHLWSRNRSGGAGGGVGKLGSSRSWTYLWRRQSRVRYYWGWKRDNHNEGQGNRGGTKGLIPLKRPDGGTSLCEDSASRWVRRVPELDPERCFLCKNQPTRIKGRRHCGVRDKRGCKSEELDFCSAERKENNCARYYCPGDEHNRPSAHRLEEKREAEEEGGKAGNS